MLKNQSSNAKEEWISNNYSTDSFTHCWCNHWVFVSICKCKLLYSSDTKPLRLHDLLSTIYWADNSNCWNKFWVSIVFRTLDLTWLTVQILKSGLRLNPKWTVAKSLAIAPPMSQSFNWKIEAPQVLCIPCIHLFGRIYEAWPQTDICKLSFFVGNILKLI